MRTLKPEEIAAVKEFLPKGIAKAVSLRFLAKKMRCSREAAMRRLEAYVEGKDIKLKRVKLREGKRGPTSVGYCT